MGRDADAADAAERNQPPSRQAAAAAAAQGAAAAAPELARPFSTNSMGIYGSGTAPGVSGRSLALLPDAQARISSQRLGAAAAASAAPTADGAGLDAAAAAGASPGAGAPGDGEAPSPARQRRASASGADDPGGPRPPPPALAPPVSPFAAATEQHAFVSPQRSLQRPSSAPALPNLQLARSASPPPPPATGEAAPRWLGSRCPGCLFFGGGGVEHSTGAPSGLGHMAVLVVMAVKHIRGPLHASPHHSASHAASSAALLGTAHPALQAAPSPYAAPCHIPNQPSSIHALSSWTPHTHPTVHTP